MGERLFVPLFKSVYVDFLSYGKEYELRVCSRNFQEKFVSEGKSVTCSCGYSGPSFEGTVGKVVVGPLEDIFNKIDYKLIIPSAFSEEEAILYAKNLLGEKDKYIAFEVLRK